MAERTNPHADIVVGAKDEASAKFAQIGQNAQKMGDSVERGAAKAGDAVGKVGDKAQPAAQKVDGATRSIIGSIERATAALKAGERGTASYFETLAKQRNVSPDALAPYLKGLREAEAAQKALIASQGNLGLSAKQMTAALRGVPAQFTDIVVSLQSGQAPITVLLQQGGQLKDMFGGVGNAAKALGGYVLGLVNPYTVAAGAVAALGLAMYGAEGQLRQQKAILTQLEATGRGAILSSEQLSSLRKELRELPGVTKAFADATISEFARTRQIGSDLFGPLSRSVADFAAATGQQIPEAAKTLAKAFADPEQGAKQLDQQLGILSASQLVAIQNMVDMGDTAGAQKILMEALQDRIKGLADDGLTPLGKATEAFGNAWDAAIGDMDTRTLRAANDLLGDMIGLATLLIDTLGKIKWPSMPDFGNVTANRAAGGGIGMAAGTLLFGPGIGTGMGALIGSKLAAPTQTGGATGSWELAKDPLDEEVKSLIKLTGGYKSVAGEMEKMRGQASKLGDTMAEMRKKGQSGTDEYKQLAQNLAGLKERMAEVAKRGGADARAAAADALRAELQAYKNNDKAILDERKAFFDKLVLDAQLGVKGEFETLDARLEKEEEVWGKRKANFEAELEQAAKKKNSAAEVARITGQMQDAERDYEQSKAKLEADAALAADKYVKGLDDRVEKQKASTRAVQDQVKAAERETAAIGLTGDALREFNAVQLDESIPTMLKVQASFAGLGGQMGELGKAAKDQIQAMRDLAKAQGEAFSAKLVYDYKKGIEESHRLLQAEIGLMGLSSRERNIAIEQLKIRLDLEKKIADIKAREPDAEKRDAKIAEVRGAAAIAEADAANRVMLEEWKQSVQQYDDIFRQGFADMMNNGKDGWKSFTKSLATTFKTTVADQIYKMFLQPIVINLVGNLMGFVGLGGSLLGGGGGSSILGTANTGIGAANLFSGGGIGGAVFGSSGAYSTFVPGLTYGSQQASMLAAQTGDFGLFGLEATSAAGGGSAMGAIGGAASVLGLAALGYFGASYFDKGDTFSGAAYASSKGDDRMPQVISGAVNPDVITGDLPDRQVIVGKLKGYGAKDRDLEGLNDRQLHRLLLLAESEVGMERDGGPMMNWSGWADANKDLPDFYRGPGYASPEGLGWWEVQDQGSNDRYRGMDSFFVDPKIVEASRKLAQGILEPYDKLSEQLGLEADYRVTTGAAYNDKTGKIFGGLSIRSGDQELINWGKREFDNKDQYAQALFTDSLEGLEGLKGMPEWAKKQSDDAQKAIAELKGENIGEEAAKIYSGATTAISQTYAQIKRLTEIIPDLAGASQDAVYDIGQAFGSLENYASAYGGFVQNFWKPEERAAYVRKNINASLSEYGISVDEKTTREDYRRLAEEQDLTTEKGRAAYAAIIKAGDAFASITPEVDALTQKLQEMSQQIGGDFTNVLTQGLLGNVTGADLGGQLADAVIGGVYNALASNAAQQITTMLMDTMITPMLKAAMTGSLTSATISQAAIDNMVANAKAAAKALNAIFNDPAFKQFLADIDGVIKEIVGSAPTQPYYNAYANQQRQQQQQQQQSTATKSAADAVKSAQDAAYDALQRAIDAEKKRIQTALDAARTLEQETRGVFDFLHQQVRDLYGQVDDTAAMQADQGRAFVEEALAAFRATGALPEQEGLTEAVDAVRRQLDQDVYSSAAERDFAKLVLAGQLDALRGGAESQLSDAEQQVSLLEAQIEQLDATLKTAKDQLDVLRGIDNSVLSVADAIAKWNVQIGNKAGSPLTYTPSASFDVGTNFVPSDMTARVHQGERIIPRADNAALMAMLSRSGTGEGSAAVVSEIRALREENRIQAAKIVLLQSQVSKVLAKWDADGMPKEREEASA